MYVYKLIFSLICYTLVALPAHAQWGVPEIPNPQLPDIAMVTVLPNGQPAIIFNPYLCQQAGPFLCGFFRKHEHCHINLGHTLRQIWPQQKELEADCCAAKIASSAEANAAYQWFSSGMGSSPIHGFGPQRAHRIRFCRG